MLDGQVLVATIRKTSKFNFSGRDNQYVHNMVGYDRQRLIHDIERQYGVKLVKDEADDFPWFTDGGFKFTAENNSWKFEIDSHVYDLV
jgi:hypothetical protein